MASSGGRIECEGLGSVTLGMMRRYRTLEALVDAEGWLESDDAEQVAALVWSAPRWDSPREDSDGILALRVRWAKREA